MTPIARMPVSKRVLQSIPMVPSGMEAPIPPCTMQDRIYGEKAAMAKGVNHVPITEIAADQPRPVALV